MIKPDSWIVKLGRKGMITPFEPRQVKATEDGRGTVCSLTSEGARVFKRAAVVHVRGIQEHFAARFTDQEAAELTRLLRRVIGDWPPPDRDCVHPDDEIEMPKGA